MGRASTQILSHQLWRATKLGALEIRLRPIVQAGERDRVHAATGGVRKSKFEAPRRASLSVAGGMGRRKLCFH